METVNRNNYRKTSIALIALLLIAVAVLTIVAVSVNTIAYADTQYPDWLPDDYTVGITLGGYYQNYGLVTSMDYADNESYVFVYIFYRVPQNADAKDLKVRIRTKNGTAVAGDDYKAFDDVVTLRRSSYVGILSNGSTRYYCDHISIDIKNDATRLIVDGKRPYFEVELYDVLSEGFTIEESARTLRVNLSSKNAHSYTTQYAFGTYMLSGYLCDDRRSTDSLNIYSEDKANQALSASYTPNLNDSAFKKDYKDLGIADYYMGVKLKLDEKGVSLSSWCYLDLYDGNTSGLHLYHGEFRSIWDDDLKPGIYYEDMKHQNESFASGTDSFKDESEKYGRLQAYYFRVSSGTLYETFKNGSNYWRKTFGWVVSTILIDDTAPQIKGWYVDKGTIQKGDKIRISVRFNEPLNATQTELRNVKLRAVFSGSGGFNNYNATFNCVNAAGSLPSDTLIFEFDPSQAKDAYDAPLIGTINNIEIAGFDKLNLIKDYGRNQNNNNNYCGNYTTLQSLESAKMSPRQLRSDLKISFDNRSPVIEQSASVSNEYVDSFHTTVTTSNTTLLQGTYYLWSQSPDLNYTKVATPVVGDLDTYYEISGDSFVKTHDADIVVDKTYFVPRAFDLAKTYEFLQIRNASALASYDDVRRYAEFTPFDIGYTVDGNFDTTLSGVSGTYYLHVYAKTIYSDEASESRRFGPIHIDNAAPKFSAITPDADSLSEKLVTAHVEELSGFRNIILHLREVGFDVQDAEADVQKFLLYGTTDDTTVTVPEAGAEASFQTALDLASGSLSFTLSAEHHLGLSETGDKAYGDYYIGLVGTDLVGNTSVLHSTDTKTSFDLRATFAPYVKIGGVDVTDQDGVLIPANILFYADNAYVVDISEGAKTIVIGRPGNIDDDADAYIVSSVIRYQNNVRTDLHFVKDTDYTVEANGNANPYLSFDLDTPGYYEFITRATFNATDSFSKTVRMYVTDGNGNSETGNYDVIFNKGVNLKNKLFALSTSRYYSRTGTGMGSSVSSYYNDSTEPLLFSSREKAVDYVKMMEYRDFYAVRFTEADMQAFNNGTIVTDRTEPRRPSVGEVWIRYKATTWNFSTNQRDWVYYYYGGSTVNTTVDINAISDSLASVVDQVANIITQKGDWTYLTSQAGTNENGALYVDPSRIPQSFTATTSLGTPSTGLTYSGAGANPLEYAFDKDVYYDLYNDENDVTLISSYKFSYLNTTKIYYAQAQYDAGNLVTGISAYANDYVPLTAAYLSQAVASSGVYAVRELDEKGMRDYFVYVDVTVPTIRGQYTGIDSDQETYQWWTQGNDGDVLYTTSFSISYIYDKAFDASMTEVNDYLDQVKDADTYAYIAVFDVTDGGKTLVASLSLTELKEPGAVYELPYGVYVVEVYDRAGNHFGMTVSRAETELTSTIEIVDNDSITFMVHDRIPSEIDKVYVTRPGMASQEIDFAEQAVVVTRNGKDYYALTYTDAGQYDFTVIDRYGYTLSPSTDPDQAGKTHTVGNLVRVNPYETVTWVTRTEDGRFVELDASDISLFRADTYYITSDDKLTFVLDSTTVYSYAFTGNVNATEIERTVDGKKYLYVNVDSTERWSVRIYYTLYPDVAVTFNRIAKRAVVPAAINLRALDKDSKGVAQADESNRIVVYVYTTDELVSNVTVRLRTRDRSAIASLGDYDETDLTVVLTPSEKEKMVTIQTHPSGISTYNSKTYEYANRTFDLFIDSVEGNAEKGKSSMECAVPGVQELNIVEKDGILVFEDYLAGAKHGLPNVAMEYKSELSNVGSYDYSNDFSISASWLSTFINSGLADLYVSGGMSISADDDSNSSALRLTLTEKSTGKQLFRVYLNNLMEHATITFGNTYKNEGEDDDDQPKVTNVSYDKATSIKLTENRGNAIAGQYFYVPATANGLITLNVHEDEYTYVVHTQYGVHTYYKLPGRNLNDVLGYSLLVDTKAPTIKSWHVDHNTITVGEKLRLSIRFSEPVYISGAEPYVFADATGTSQSLTFTYAGGAGTDTLYFEFDPSAFTGEINITGISLGNIKNYSSIFDYAYNGSKKNNVVGLPEIPKDTEWDNSCSLDTRIPRVDLDGTYVPSANPQRNASVPLNVSKVTSGAELQYSWTVESDAPADYEKTITMTSAQQRVTVEAKGLSGTYYLHAYIKSVYGKVTTETYGPFYFDNDMPSITGLVVEEATKGLKERNVTFYVSDEPKGQASSGIAQVYLYYLIKGEDSSKLLTLYDVNGDERTNIITILDNNRVSFLLRYDMLGIRKEEQKDVTLAVYAVDGLGNSGTISTYTFCPAVVNFDVRSEVGVTMTCDKGEFFNADSIPVYNVASAPSFDFSFSKQADEFDVRQLFIGGKEIAESKFGDYIDYTADIDGVHVKFKSGVVGFVRINFKASTGAGANHTVQESSDITFYLTNGTDKAETANYKATASGTLLINKVYMLEAGSVYYYHNGEGVRQKNYNNTSKTMAFSSRAKAIEYVTYYEMQDLSTRVLTASEASALNVGDGNYRKAAADASVNASAGQVWIRYKRVTWDRSESANDWVYYFYGTASEIDPERLPASLSSAIAQVAETIVSRGGYRYLTSADDYLDKNGAPYLDAKQIAVARLTTYVTNTGEDFRSVVVYEGDPDIYDSTVTPAGADEPCSLVTTYNFAYGEYTKLFYTNQTIMTDAGEQPNAKEFKLLPEGTVFGSLNIDGGVYWLRECDENGMRDFKVYLDKSAPGLTITYENAKGDSIDRELDSSVDGMSINGKVLKIKGFSASAAEIDTMAYIAVFKKNGIQLNVYRKEDIPTAGIEIGEGQYYLEIADRSGNMFKVSVSLNSTPMEVKVLPEENRHVRITCNRDASEIKEFEIYLDNKLLESNYSSSVTYYQSGVYSIHIEDWFGNTFNYNYELKRELPKVSWYYDENDNYIAYDGTQSCMTITKTGDREYTIVTNKQLMFMYDTSAEYEYEFSDRSISKRESEFNGYKRIRINDPVDWKVTIRYARYPEIYVTYTCLMDTTPPIINVSARQDVVRYFDLQEIEDENVKRPASPSDPDESVFFVPDTAYFGVTKTITRAVRNGASIYSTLITLQFDDKSVCSEVEIYLDGVMIREYEEGEGVNNITLNRFGEYRIVARDTLGNQSEFSFVNRTSDAFKYIVDGREIDTKLSPADSIVDEGEGYTYQADAYSFDSVEFLYGGSGRIVFLIEKNGAQHYLRYDSVDGALYEVAYRLIQRTDEEGNPLYYEDTDNEIWQYQQIYASTVIRDLSAVESDKSFVLATEEEVGVNIYVRFDADKNVYYHVDAPKSGEATVIARIAYNDEYQPYFTKTVMNGELPEVTLEYVGDDQEQKRITPESTEQIVYLNGSFFVTETAFNNITDVTVAYSRTTEFGNPQVIYRLNDGYRRIGNVETDGGIVFIEGEDAFFTVEGFYQIIAKNIYGRVAKYMVTMSNDLSVEVTTEYDDGFATKHLVKDDTVYKANKQVTVDVYADYITYVLFLDGEQLTDEPVEINEPSGRCSIVKKDAGSYRIVINDRFDNQVIVEFVIEDKPFTFKQDYLTGYNEDALRKDDGYTNQILSVDADKMIADGIRYVTVVHGDVETVVFDLLRDEGTPVTADRITDVIGASGDGIYLLRMRNENGNVAETVLHYMGSDTLRVSRLIRTSREAEPIAIVQGEDNKIYSNYSVTFETIARKYEIRVDGDRADMPLVIRYPSDGEDTGEYRQTVTYVDEYGFKYSFEINLIRKQLNIDLTKTMKIVEINEVKMTQDDVSVEFEGSVQCEYTLDAGDRIPYQSGEKLTADGMYRFYVTDIAGNVHSAAVRKDTLVEFTFLYTGTDKVVEKGSVVMSGSARFMPVNNDSAKLDLVVLNGEEYDNTKSTGFGECGKWEFLISDSIGNKVYYYFYVLPYPLSRFEYESPYAYEITDVSFDSGDGILVSYTNMVVNNANKRNSTMVFDETGTYQVTVSSIATSAYFTFEVVIDRTPPKAELIGAVSGAKTTANVSLAGCVTGDVVKVYKDGKLIQTVEVTNSATKMPEINEKGDYKIVITNAAGNEQVFEFTRKYTANVATTVTIIVFCLLIAIGLTVVLVLRKRKKV